jgi:hypothetical protein
MMSKSSRKTDGSLDVNDESMPHKPREKEDSSLQKPASTESEGGLDDTQKLADALSLRLAPGEIEKYLFEELGLIAHYGPRGVLDQKKLATWQLETELLLQQSYPENFSQLLNSARELRTAFHVSAASFLQKPFNVHLQSMPHETYEQKQAMASWANSQLRQLGLAIKCPKTGKPAILLADIKDANAVAGRFRLETRDDSGKRVRTLSSRVLPKFELMEDQVREEPLAQWSDKIRREKRGDRGK